MSLDEGDVSDDGRITWDALIRLFDSRPSPENNDTSDFACLVLRVRELYEAARAWQQEVTSPGSALRIAESNATFFDNQDIGQELKTLVKSYNKLPSSNSEYLRSALRAEFESPSNPTIQKWLKYVTKKLK